MADDAPKYIIVEACSLECAIVFNNVVDHSAVANGLNVVSAGFCSGLASDTPCPDEISVWGRSHSLKLESRPEDADIIWKSCCRS